MTNNDDDMLPSVPAEAAPEDDAGEVGTDGFDLPADVNAQGSDIDGDGSPGSAAGELDLDGDGVADIQGISVAGDGDATPDILLQADAAQSIWGDLDDDPSAEVPEDLFEAMANACDELIFPGYAELMATSGTPDADMALWEQQEAPMSCAVATTNMMFKSMGLEPGEGLIADIFEELDVYDPIQGSKVDYIDDAINIMAATGGLDIQAETMTGLDVDDLGNLLHHGVRPLIAVDGAELYSGAGGRLLNDLGLLPDAPHAVQLIGIERTPEGDFAVINDPGFPGGAGQRIPMDAFTDAWEDSGNTCVAMSDGATMASLGTSGSADGADFQMGGMRQPVTTDAWGNQFRGNSNLPFAGPDALKPGLSSWGPKGWKML